MPPDEGRPSRPSTGIAPFGKTLHLLVQVKDARGSHQGYRQCCSTGFIDGEASEISDFEEVMPDAKVLPLPPEGKAICGNCVRMWGANKLSKIAGESAKRAESEKCLGEMVEALTKVTRVKGNPAHWSLMFDTKTYKASTKELFDPQRFEEWWFEEFLAPLALTASDWRKFLRCVGAMGKEQPEDALEHESANEMVLAREEAVEFLSSFRICEDQRDVGTAVFNGAFVADSKTWVPLSGVMTHLQKRGFKFDSTKAREALRGIVIGASRVFRIDAGTKRCWPIDAKAAGLDLVVVPSTRENGGELPPGQSRLAPPAGLN